MDLPGRMGYAEAQVVPPLSAGSAHRRCCHPVAAPVLQRREVDHSTIIQINGDSYRRRRARRAGRTSEG